MPVGRSTMALAVAAAASVGALLRSPVDWPGPSLAFILMGFGALGGLVASERKAPTLRRIPVLVVCGVLLCVAVVIPPRRSTDVWAYAMYGRMAAHHQVSPYTHAADDFPADPVASRVATVWSDSPSVYGPVFTGLSAAGMAVAGTSRLAARLFFQGLAALAVAAALLILDRRTRDPMVIAFLGVNPLTIVSVVNGSHNDALVGLAVLGGVLLAMDRRPALAGVAMATGALVKVSTILPAALLFLWVLLGQGFAAAAAFGGFAGSIVVAGFALAGGQDSLAPLGEASTRITAGSVWRKPYGWLSPDRSRAMARRISSVATAAVAGLSAALSVRRLRADNPAPLVASGVLAYMLLGPYVTPWYIAWSLPLLALSWRSPLSWLAVGHAGLLLLSSRPGPLRGDSPFRPVFGHLYSAVTPMVEVVVVVALVVITAKELHKNRTPRPVGAELLDNKA